MRLYLVLLLMGVLAFRALPTDAGNGVYSVVGMGGAACAKLSSGHGIHAEVPYGLWPIGPLDALCNLDRALLSLQKYFGSEDPSPAETLVAGVRSSRLQARSGR